MLIKLLTNWIHVSFAQGCFFPNNISRQMKWLHWDRLRVRILLCSGICTNKCIELHSSRKYLCCEHECVCSESAKCIKINVVSLNILVMMAGAGREILCVCVCVWVGGSLFACYCVGVCMKVCGWVVGEWVFVRACVLCMSISMYVCMCMCSCIWGRVQFQVLNIMYSHFFIFSELLLKNGNIVFAFICYLVLVLFIIIWY